MTPPFGEISFNLEDKIDSGFDDDDNDDNDDDDVDDDDVDKKKCAKRIWILSIMFMFIIEISCGILLLFLSFICLYLRENNPGIRLSSTLEKIEVITNLLLFLLAASSFSSVFLFTIFICFQLKKLCFSHHFNNTEKYSSV